MKIKAEINVEELVDLRIALNSLETTLRLLCKDKNSQEIHRFDYENLEKGRKALDNMIKNG